MAEVLYGDTGFYTTDAERSGRGGDFVTSPEIGVQFAAAIAAELEPGMRVADVGGRGTLAASLRDVTDVDVAVVDVSPASRERAEAAELATASTLAELEWRPDLVVANELLDNMPARLVSGAGELVVGPGDRGLDWYRIPLDASARTFANTYVPGESSGCGVVPFPTTALDWLGTVDADRLLVFDYGADAATLAAREEWPLRAYAGHRRVDPLSAAQVHADVTVEVPVDVVVDALDRLGWDVHVSSQRDWLLARWTCGGDEPGMLGRRAHASEIRALTDPAGLGGFVVIDARR